MGMCRWASFAIHIIFIYSKSYITIKPNIMEEYVVASSKAVFCYGDNQFHELQHTLPGNELFNRLHGFKDSTLVNCYLWNFNQKNVCSNLPSFRLPCSYPSVLLPCPS